MIKHERSDFKTPFNKYNTVEIIQRNTTKLRKSKLDERIKEKRCRCTESSERKSEDIKKKILFDLMKRINEISVGKSSKEKIKELSSLVGEMRKILSTDEIELHKYGLELNILEGLLMIFKYSFKTEIKYECAWTIANLSLLSAQYPQRFFNLLPAFQTQLQQINHSTEYSHFLLSEKIVWAIGNMSIDSNQIRNYIIESDMLNLIINLLYPLNTKLRTICLWTLTAIASKAKTARLKMLGNGIFKALSVVFKGYDQQELQLEEAAWLLVYLFEEDFQIDFIHIEKFLTPLIDAMLHSSLKFRTGAVRALGSIVSSKNLALAENLISNQFFITNLITLIKNPKEKLTKEAAWIFSSIAAGSPEHAKFILDSTDLMDEIMKLLNPIYDIEIRKEAAIIIYNLSQNCDQKYMQLILEKKPIPGFLEFLQPYSIQEPELVLISLSFIQTALEKIPKINLEIEEINGDDLIANVLEKYSTQNQIYDFADNILNLYFKYPE
jgi:hypothetical protein